ncbi:hypothetical protein GGTG_00489 [Gaeumannomyces tritici R3-111a-1]|uniref:Uncharacterized protein n=1 Tax=Gaeumannomyces tritici (strain R3-111a-1) TaxID=644352 RepID=J3NGV1_GAET3|nr:hypothetical protein GGTG_00489 [Gaeumannomyces tritici R3-111a-1]EJT80491.1 hypothetical protein GGTG_00489 [Gaeumannomyces tritici R3-111a-1]
MSPAALSSTVRPARVGDIDGGPTLPQTASCPGWPPAGPGTRAGTFETVGPCSRTKARPSQLPGTQPREADSIAPSASAGLATAQQASERRAKLQKCPPFPPLQ